jgi:tRNA (cmo5U34)-methyltransferase
MVKTYGQDNSNYYDLGASTGAISLALGLNNNHNNNQIIAIDNSLDNPPNLSFFERACHA